MLSHSFKSEYPPIILTTHYYYTVQKEKELTGKIKQIITAY